ncbi:hypothetical protein P153DRAFT_370361 [Dothidotthia symphoricarpi CBS 119687]|uniref:Uncharacterized protein n=1 Tax=Dothidotthia symphoricarpi CBS 119687 TaxID=1392245 RepID=A0A6A6A385_9PLEO|nr:uncharacterized protein P153DRAFT_370361 [Dothidotthia symphoricarpi CBS 119687]KAF2125041.1 hypothetical protein P153DRAFT_370361 [Dothidotthia symphoricarpi CBS 119687]
MPRPPRSKVASTTTRTTRVAKKPAPPKQPAKLSAAQTRKANAALNSFSEDSDGLVTKSTSTRPRRGMPWEKTPEPVDEADLVMTGALPAEEDVPLPSTKKRTPAPRAKTTRATRGSARTAARKSSPPATVRSLVEAAQEDAPQEEENSGYGDLTFSSLASESPAHGTRPPSAIKVGATPAHETSILALTNFKRRARQPSLLRMVQQTTDVEDNDQDTLDDTDNFDFDDFVPHDESTPLNVRKNAPEDGVRNDSGTQVSSSGTRGTKRTLSPVIQVPRSSPPFDMQSSPALESPRSPSPSLPDVTPSHEIVVEQTQEDSEPMSETLAPPKSSSPVRAVSEIPSSPAQTRVGGRGRQARKATNYNDESEGEETETPAKAKKGAKTKAQQNISTAQLKGLLPRRRTRMRLDRDEFDLESSDVDVEMDSDQDELQMPARRSHQRKPPSPKVTKKTARGKKTAASTKAAQKTSRTYGRRISSDKENAAQEKEVEETTEPSIVEQSEKLAAIRKKFEEVDAFELEFENVDVTASSSPFR